MGTVMVSKDGQEMVKITKRLYESLQKDSDWLSALEEAGVDNWPGIDHAHEISRGYTEEDDEE